MSCTPHAKRLPWRSIMTGPTRALGKDTESKPASAVAAVAKTEHISMAGARDERAVPCHARTALCRRLRAEELAARLRRSRRMQVEL
jgi:hypothetical protein